MLAEDERPLSHGLPPCDPVPKALEKGSPAWSEVRVGRAWGVLGDLPKLTMPTVFALGVRDPIVRPDQTLALQRIKPDLEVRRIMGLTTDHVLITSTPERVAAEILCDEIDGLSIGLRTGSGTPVVLPPELQEAWRTLKEAAEALAADHEVVALDLLGVRRLPGPAGQPLHPGRLCGRGAGHRQEGVR